MGESELFLAARRLEGPERLRYLDEQCGNDVALRHGVQELLDADDDDTEYNSWKTYQASAANIPIGSLFANRFALQEKIGQGGMGTVFLAEQKEPVHRRVAVKILKSTFVTPSALARFEQERHVLALMDHPHIARIYDAGIGDLPGPGGETIGYPYLVMEYISGTPITEYCQQHQLSARQRIELMIPVCEAIQHAHQKGIIHRDLKPSNILVTQSDDKAMPKVIDFGVAKATESKLTERSINTDLGTLIGTLEYMSPEQSQLDNLDIDTRTDVYALGVILYELLTGTVPFHRKDLEQAGLIEMLRVIKEVDPPNPSTKLSEVREKQEKSQSTAKYHSSIQAVSGDLDCIVMKALRKDRDNRYATAVSLGNDLQRYLNDQPIEARPFNAGYLFQKMLRRHRKKLIATAAVLVTFLVTTIGACWGWMEAEAQRVQAEHHADEARIAAQQERVAREAAQDARKLAVNRLQEVQNQHRQSLAEQQRAEALSDFIVNDVIRQAGKAPGREPIGPASGEMTVKEALTRAAPSIQRKYSNQPLLAAVLEEVLGKAFYELGDSQKGEQHIRQASILRGELPPVPKGRSIASVNSLLGRSFIQSVTVLEAQLARQVMRYGAAHASSIATAKLLAQAYQQKGKHQQAIELLRETCEHTKTVYGQHHLEVHSTQHLLARAHHAALETDQAMHWYQTVYIDAAKYHGPEAAITLKIKDELMLLYADVGRSQHAVTFFQQHVEALQWSSQLGSYFLKAGKRPEAYRHLHLAFIQQSAQLGSQHADTLLTSLRLGDWYCHAGYPGQAFQQYVELANIRVRQPGTLHPDTKSVLVRLSQCWMMMHRLAIP